MKGEYREKMGAEDRGDEETCTYKVSIDVGEKEKEKGE